LNVNDKNKESQPRSDPFRDAGIARWGLWFMLFCFEPSHDLSIADWRKASVITKPTVLVADDEHIVANTLATILNQAGFDARAVYSGEKLVETAQTFLG
jgi:hypothetical protein